MPTEIALRMPSGDAAALTELAGNVAAAAFCLGLLDERLLGTAASAPGWLGDDAGAAATQVGTIAALVGAMSEALRPAIARLDTHAERLLETRRQVTALMDEQEEQFAEAWRRWGRVQSLQLQVMTGGPEVRAIVDEVEAGEASRRRRHTALLEELEDDAAATARVLADSCAVVGGRGTPDDGSRVVAHLAAQLPGWGDLELARRGRALAEDLIDTLSSERRDELSGDALPLAGSAVFADAFLAALGPLWMRDLLEALGEGDLGPTSSLALLVAGAVGAASRSGGTGPATEVLAAEYTSADDPAGREDLAVLGMGTVLAASLALGSRGLGTQTVAAWGRQIALRERTLGAASVDRVNPSSDDAAPVDPLPFVVTILADASDPAAAAAFMSGPAVWDVLLSRQWEDCGTALSRLVRGAAAVAGPVGDAVVRGGLEALGAGLEDGDPGGWTVNRGAANGVSPALGEAVAAHVSVAGDALADVSDGDADAATGDLLRGLGYLTLDRNAAAAVEQALSSWLPVQRVGLGEAGSLPQLPAVVVPNAYLAVQEYGQRLAYTLRGYDRQQEAEDRSFAWNMTAGVAAALVPGPWGVVAGVVEGSAAREFGFDGTWDNGVDRGLTFEADTALGSVPAHERDLIGQIVRQARASFADTTAVLGHPIPPESPVTVWWEPLLGGLENMVKDPADLKHGHGSRLHLPR